MRYFVLRNCIIEVAAWGFEQGCTDIQQLERVDRIRFTPILTFPHQGGRNNLEGAAYVDE